MDVILCLLSFKKIECAINWGSRRQLLFVVIIDKLSQSEQVRHLKNGGVVGGSMVWLIQGG